jgi:hypothetical protein
MLRRTLSLLAALVVCAALPSVAAARSETGIFAVEVSGTTDASWANAGEATCSSSGYETLDGSLTEHGSFRALGPAVFSITGLNGTLGPLGHYRLNGDEDEGIPVQVDVDREGGYKRLDCPGEQVITGPECLGARSYQGDMGFGVDGRVALYTPGDRIDTEIYRCEVEDGMEWARPSGLLRGGMYNTSFKGRSIRAWLMRAKNGTKPLVLKLSSTSPCNGDWLDGCHPGTAQATLTISFVCRARSSSKSCLTPATRRKYGIAPR